MRADGRYGYWGNVDDGLLVRERLSAVATGESTYLRQTNAAAMKGKMLRNLR